MADMRKTTWITGAMALAAGALLNTAAARADVFIDDFLDGAMNLSLTDLTGTVSDPNRACSPTCVGGDRDSSLTVDKLGGDPDGAMEVDPAGPSGANDGVLNASSATGAGVIFVTTWDGMVGGVDLSGGDKFEVKFLVHDLQTKWQITVSETAAAGGTTETINVTVPGGLNDVLAPVPFNLFSAAIDFSQIDLVTFAANVSDGTADCAAGGGPQGRGLGLGAGNACIQDLDFTIDFIRVPGDTPDGEFSKELTSGPDRPGDGAQHVTENIVTDICTTKSETTLYDFTITYTFDIPPDVLIVDTVTNLWEIQNINGCTTGLPLSAGKIENAVTLNDGVCGGGTIPGSIDVYSTGGNNSKASGDRIIEWTPAGPNGGSINVLVATRQSPGGGRRAFFAPTSTGDVVLNGGAVAFELGTTTLADTSPDDNPTSGITLNAIDCD